MRSRRPTSVLVLAILQLIFGGIGLLCMVCSGGGKLAGIDKMAQANQGAQGAGQQRLQQEMERLQKERQPSYQPIYSGVQMGGSLVDITLMLVGGIGLLQMRPWGRWLTIVYAVLSIALNLVAAVYTFAVEAPLMNEIMVTLRSQGGWNDQERMVLDMMGTFGKLGGVIPLLLIIYPIIVLVILLRPSVAAAFAGISPPAVEDEPADYRDEPEDRREG